MPENAVETLEQTALTQFIGPAEELAGPLCDAAADGVVRITLRSDVQYESSGEALRRVRERRKAFAAYWKEDPGKPQADCGPGQGMGYFTRRAWEAANSLFNRFDGRLGQLDDALTAARTKYRAEVERKAREEAEQRAKEEQARAARERERAEAARRKAEEEANAARRKAEEEVERRRKADLAAANTKREREEAERRAREAKERAERDAAEAKRRADEAEDEAKRAADERLRLAESAPVTRVLPTSGGRASVRKHWKAEVLDLGKLIKAVADGRASESLLLPNQPQLNKLADALGGQAPPDGVRFFQQDSDVVR